MRDRRQLEIIAGRVNADGTIAAGDGFTVTRTGVGSYVIRLPNFRLISVTMSPTGGGTNSQINTIVSDGFTAIPANTAGAAIDASFAFVAAGVQQ